MTSFLVLVTLFAALELVVGWRLLRQDRPASPPDSRLDWAPPGLPSTPYAARR